jgi:hypothetical protein
LHYINHHKPGLAFAQPPVASLIPDIAASAAMHGFSQTLGIIFPTGVFQFVLKIFQAWNNIPKASVAAGITLFRLHNHFQIMHKHAQIMQKSERKKSAYVFPSVAGHA